MSDFLRVYGVPSDLADGTEVVRGADTLTPLLNPTPSEEPNPGMSPAEAHALLLDLVQKDGWAALYDPTDEASVVQNGSNQITAIKNSAVGTSFPDMVLSAPVASLGVRGALRNVTLGASRYMQASVDPAPWTVLSVVSNDTQIQTGQTDGSLIIVGPGGGSYRILASSPAGNKTSPTAYAMPTNPSDNAGIVEVPPAKDFFYVGNHAVYPDSEADRDDLAGIVSEQSGLVDGVAVVYGTPGPVVIGRGDVSPEARERMNRLLCQLSGIPITVENTIDWTPGGYCVLQEDDPTGVSPLASFRPDRPQQLASVTKTWTSIVAYEIFEANSVDLNVLRDLTDSYIGQHSVKYPQVYAGDQMTLNDMIHGTIMRSHNQIVDAVAYHAGVILSGSSDFMTAVDAFVAHMNDVAVNDMGWSEAVFTTPQGRYDNILTPRHVAEMVLYARDNVPYIYDVLCTDDWEFTLVRADPAPGESGTLVDTWTSNQFDIFRDSKTPYPEVLGGKTGHAPVSLGDEYSFQLIWRDPRSGKKTVSAILDGAPHFTTAISTGIQSLARYARVQMDAIEKSDEIPAYWSSAGTDAEIRWARRDSAPGGGSVVAFPRPDTFERLAPETRVSPFDQFRQSLPRVEAGDTIQVSARIVVPPTGETATAPTRDDVTLFAQVSGGMFSSASGATLNTSRNQADSTRVVTEGVGTLRIFTATVSRGGLLDVGVRSVPTTEDRMTGVEVYDFSLKVNQVQIDLTFWDMELISYQVNESAQSVDSSDLNGPVGDFSAETVRPESGTVVQRFGTNWLKGRDAQLFTSSGNARGVIGSVNEVDGTRFSITGPSPLQSLVALRAEGLPYSGTLGQLIAQYLGQAQGVSFQVDIDPTLATVPVVAPYWRGELWSHLKMLGAVYGFNVFLDGFTLRVAPVPGSEIQNLLHTGRGESLDEGSEARYVEVIKYSGRIHDNEPVYPPGGLSDDTTVITVREGETVTVELPVEVSLTSVTQPECVSRVEKDTTGSVFSVVDNNGAEVHPAVWAQGGGSLSVALGDNRDSILVTITAPSRGTLLDGQKALVYTLGSLRGQGTQQFSTLRVLGSGVGITPETFRVATGSETAVTEVGVTIDNPFIVTWSQAAENGTRAALKYGGFRPDFQAATDRVPLGAAPNRILNLASYDYRILGASHSPSASSVTAEYHMDHDRYESLYSNDTYGSIEEDMTTPDTMTYRDDQVIGKRRP